MRFLSLLLPLLLLAQSAILPIPQKVTYDKKLAQLGKILFFDPTLSSDETISCASCHKPSHAGADDKPLSIGVGGQKGDLNSPTVYNALFNIAQFWNGRATTLQEQVAGPLHNPKEMNMSDSLLLVRLQSSSYYANAFQKLFGSEKITVDMVAKAIAEFEKALYTPDSKFDRFLRKETTLSPAEHRGYLLFKELGCITCHNGVNLGGNSFQKIGTVIPYPGTLPHDRYEVTKNPADKGVYKVPSLRNIARTAPYFHDGSVPTLRQAVEKMSYHNLGFRLTPKEQRAIVAFLKTLTGRQPAILREEQ